MVVPGVRYDTAKKGSALRGNVFVSVLKYAREVAPDRDSSPVFGDSRVAHDGCDSKIRSPQARRDGPHRRNLVTVQPGKDSRLRDALSR